MKRDELQQKIESFYGNMNTAFEFIAELNRELNIDFSNIFESSNPDQKMITFIRNLINRNIISRPMKTGRSLILDGRTIVQILVAKRYLNMGLSMNSLAGYIEAKPTGELLEKLFMEQLPDIQEITTAFSSSLAEDQMQAEAGGEIDSASDTDLFHHLEINSDMQLVVRQGAYSNDVVERIVKYLKRQKRS